MAEMRVPQASVVTDLARYDARLRLRWAHRTSVWIIERKMPERHVNLLAERPNPFTREKSWDLWDGWKEGYLHVLSVHPDLLNTGAMWRALQESDLHAQGSIETMARKLDAIEAAEEAATQREISNWSEAAAKEAHDRLAWLQGRRVAVPETVAPSCEDVDDVPEPPDILALDHQRETIPLGSRRRRHAQAG